MRIVKKFLSGVLALLLILSVLSFIAACQDGPDPVTPPTEIERTEPDTAGPEKTEPAVLDPVTEESDSTDPGETVPETTLPDITEPDTSEPFSTLPETTEPETTPQTTSPATTAPVTTKPQTTSPATTAPVTTKPQTTAPATTAPVTTKPQTTAPATTTPVTTKPQTTSPATTAPVTTQPQTTAPVTTQPQTTFPATTVPETTEPQTTSPVTSAPETTEPEPVVPRVKTEAEYSYTLSKATSMYHFYQITARYQGENHKFQIRVPIVSAYEYEPEEASALMDPQIETLNRMAQSSANVRLWVYVATCLEDSALMADIIPSEDLSSNYPYFASRLDPTIWIGHLEPFDIAERNHWYYGTDHHWSTDGWYEAYTELLNAMHEVYPDVSPREGTRVDSGSTYYGSIARDNGALGCPKDRFFYYTFPLDAHTVEIQKDKKGNRLYASEVPFEENIPKYENGQQNTSDNFDHYVNFYPICKEVVFPGNSTGRNLLFMGDSFSLGVQELIASHFDHSY
ncbi:MAG: hypothetical protein II797_00650, partial [Clostridia bacterium]|nr:hypothetical protein [Clostridia bacterium]